MAQGRAQEASQRYRLARQIARKSFSSDPCLTVGTDVLMIELDLERNREKAIQQRTLKNLMEVRGIWVDIYSTALAVSAELTFAQYDSRAVIRLLTRAVDDVQATGIESLSNAGRRCWRTTWWRWGVRTKRDRCGASKGCPAARPSCSTSRASRGARWRRCRVPAYGCWRSSANGL